MHLKTAVFLQILPAITLAAGADSARQALARRSGRTDPVLVTAVRDGDTISVASIGSVSLSGMRPPGAARRKPNRDEAFARDARAALASYVLNRWVRLEFEDTRHVYVWLETGRLVNEAMLADGLAELTAQPGTPHYERLAAAQEQAKAARRGIWRRQ